MEHWSKVVKAVGRLGRIPAVLLASVLSLYIMAGLYPKAPIPLFEYATGGLAVTVILVSLVAILRR